MRAGHPEHSPGKQHQDPSLFQPCFVIPADGLTSRLNSPRRLESGSDVGILGAARTRVPQVSLLRPGVARHDPNSVSRAWVTPSVMCDRYESRNGGLACNSGLTAAKISPSTQAERESEVPHPCSLRASPQARGIPQPLSPRQLRRQFLHLRRVRPQPVRMPRGSVEVSRRLEQFVLARHRRRFRLGYQ